MKITRRECIHRREGSNKIEKSETESSTNMQGTRLYRQSFEERLQSDTMNNCREVERQKTVARLECMRGCKGTG